MFHTVIVWQVHGVDTMFHHCHAYVVGVISEVSAAKIFSNADCNTARDAPQSFAAIATTTWSRVHTGGGLQEGRKDGKLIARGMYPDASPELPCASPQGSFLFLLAGNGAPGTARVTCDALTVDSDVMVPSTVIYTHLLPQPSAFSWNLARLIFSCIFYLRL